MRTYFLLIYSIFLLFGVKRAEAEVLSGELENPGYDPLFWVSSTDCSLIETEANKRYQNFSGLLKIEQNIVMNDLCHTMKGCNLKWCKEFESANKDNPISSESGLDNLKPETKAKAELGKLLKERRASWKDNILQAKKTEQLEKLSWQKLVMPFDSVDEEKPLIQPKTNLINPNQGKFIPTANPAAQTNLPTKKDKYFNVLKK